jgi:hypothetical protein
MKPALAAVLLSLALAPAVPLAQHLAQAQHQAAPAPAQPGATPRLAQKPRATAARKTPVVGSLDAAPERKLGAAKPPCVYKPVMTNEDIDNCR